LSPPRASKSLEGLCWDFHQGLGSGFDFPAQRSSKRQLTLTRENGAWKVANGGQ